MFNTRSAAFGLLLATAAAVAPSTATAATTLTRYDFTANFSRDAVISQVNGFFVIQGDTVTGFGTLADIGVTIGSTVFTMANSGGGRFNYTNQFSRAGGVLGDGDDEFSISRRTNDFSVVIFDRPPTGDFADTGSYLLYTAENWSGFGRAEEGDGTFRYTRTDITAAVPEPATWAMLIGGFGMMGGMMRRRATKVAYATA